MKLTQSTMRRRETSERLVRSCCGGKEQEAQPLEAIDKLLAELEGRMEKRLKRDFHSRGRYLPSPSQESETIQLGEFNWNSRSSCNPSSATTDVLEQQNSKKRKFSLMNSSGSQGFETDDAFARQNNRRMKLGEGVNTIDTGEFRIFVDEPFRGIIPSIVRVIDEYESSCAYFKFKRVHQSKEKSELSWIGKETIGVKTERLANIALPTISRGNVSYHCCSPCS